MKHEELGNMQRYGLLSDSLDGHGLLLLCYSTTLISKDKGKEIKKKKKKELSKG